MNKIKELRIGLGLSLRELAKKSNVSPTYLYNLENMLKKNPSKDTMQKISDGLGESVAKIFF